MPSRGVALPPQHTGSSLFYELLSAAIAQFPELKGTELPAQANAWKRNYGQVLARFEAMRVASPQRVEIARFIVERAQAALQFVREGGASQPLAEHFAEAVSAPSLQSQQLGAAPSFQVDVPFEGRRYRGREALELIERLSENGDLTLAARAALRWTVEHIEGQGALDLRDQRFVLLGAGAELAPTAALLAAGAQVLWVDVSDASTFLAAHKFASGTLLQASQPLNLLENPALIAAAIEHFAADGGAVHLGAFAYASGASREWRLGAAMNAIASQLSPSSLRSLTMLVSPTTVPTWQPDSLRFVERQLAREPIWKATLSRTGLLPKPGHFASNGAHIGLSTVSIQGLSYQAAQYISKLCAAETFASGWQREPLTVSANVAGITRTRSMSHPLFAAAFLGAPRFGVRIFAPESTRALSLLLMLHDLLNPAASGANGVNGNGDHRTESQRRAELLHAKQIHGGLYNMPYALEPAIRIAALIGMGQNPSVLLRRRSQPSAAAAPV